MIPEQSDEVQKQMKDYVKRLQESPVLENRLVGALMDDAGGRFCFDEAVCRAKVRKLVTIYENDSPGDFLARKNREREEFQKGQDDAFKIKLLTQFLADAERWQLGPQETKERELWIGRLKHHGIVPQKAV